MVHENPRHVFIVEDNELYAMMLDYILTKESIYQFVSFRSGEECIKNLYMNPDIIILDHGLPGMDGYETLLEIKKRNPAAHVIMLTNNTDRGVRGKLMMAGADDFVLKQGHGETQIIEKIENILNQDEMEKSFYYKMTSNPILKRAAFLVLLLAMVTLGVACFA